MPEAIYIMDTPVSLYYIFWFLGIAVAVCVGCYLGNRNGIGFAHTVFGIAGTVAMGLLLMWLTSFIIGGGELKGINFVRISLYLPIPIYILSKIFREPLGKFADTIAPLPPIIHGIGHIGCIFPGCCYGYPCSWGLYSNAAGKVCFPVQLLEAAAYILIGVLLVAWHMKGKQKGKLFAWYLALFGFLRFVLEFLRDNEKLWLGMSEFAFHSLAAMIIGILAIILIGRRLRKEE